MIPLFPKFKILQTEDFEEIESLTKEYPPYSDFSFTSLWTYNANNATTISKLNNNLVVRMEDYVNLEPFLTFIGSKDSVHTAHTLLSTSKKLGVSSSLKLVPEINITKDLLAARDLSIIEDVENFDYVFPLKEISELKGQKYHKQRNLRNFFENNYQDLKCLELDILDRETQEQMMKLFDLWSENKTDYDYDTGIEKRAIERLYLISNLKKFPTIGIVDNEKLVAFSINEILSERYAGALFRKADINYKGIYKYLESVTAKKLLSFGCELLNYEQDLGIPGLRHSKELWKPTDYLKKYIISLKVGNG